MSGIAHKNNSFDTGLRVLAVENGCKFHDDCFTCPFEDCLYDGARRGTVVAKEKIQMVVRGLFTTGLTHQEIAARAGISMRTVYRYLEV